VRTEKETPSFHDLGSYLVDQTLPVIVSLCAHAPCFLLRPRLNGLRSWFRPERLSVVAILILPCTGSIGLVNLLKKAFEAFVLLD
jgi:hypothetical protein